MEKTDRKRRKFIKAIIGVSGGLLLTWRYLTPWSATPDPEEQLEVKQSEIPPHGALVYPESGVAVIRSNDEFYALDLTCTHLGCTVQVTPTELICPCHGSRFDRYGKVLHGPANRSLRRLRIEERGGKLFILA